jgi:hypothetical protein
LDKADYHFRSTGCVQDGCTTVFMTSENSADNRYRFEDSYRSASSGEVVPRWWVVADTNDIEGYLYSYHLTPSS